MSRTRSRIMSWTSNDVLGTLVYLLPGFITAWIFFSLTCFKRPSEFERVVQALIYSVFIQAFVVCIRKILFVVCEQFVCAGQWSADVQLVWSVATAITFGLLASWFANNDKLHGLFRKLNITKQTSYPTEWYRNFFTIEGFVILDLSDGRRILGEIDEWPNESAAGHFSLLSAHWIEKDGVLVGLEKAKSILIPAHLVEFVEFMKEEAGNDCENSK